ncbi:hypothetical protein ACFY3U_20035 [Micromonospora sp. NPDC000089]|uniref:hypothetical protein n=1 Tax=unclassified Micromonospora TaxID=2617518 RepID=UPI0036AD9DD6
MVYRYQSDEDAFAEYPPPGAELAEVPAGSTAPAGPSPSRFPTPSLPRAARPAPPAAATIPVRSSFQPGPTRSGYAPTEPLDLPRSRRAGGGGGGRMWQVVIGGAAVLVLLGLAGLGTAALLVDRTTDDPAVQETQAAPADRPSAAAPSTAPSPQGLDSRQSDPQPLTAKEVFPGSKLVIGPNRSAYPVLKTQAGRDCAVAATGEVAGLLVRLGCNQVVRATLRSPDDDYLATAGLFNLTDAANADRARERIRQLLDQRKGRFRGMPADDDTAAIATAAARVGWQVRGHYVAYCLVTRADGEALAAGDTNIRAIISDLIELHLNRVVLDRRANGGSVVQPGASAAATSPSTRRTTDPDTGSRSNTDDSPDELPGN